MGQLRLGKECKKLRGLKSLLDHDGAENRSRLRNALIEVLIPYKEVVSRELSSRQRVVPDFLRRPSNLRLSEG